MSFLNAPRKTGGAAQAASDVHHAVLSMTASMTRVSCLKCPGSYMLCWRLVGATCIAGHGPSVLQLAGVIIAPVAVLFMAYALYRYKRRTQQASHCVLSRH